ncbi:MAG: hypothetical protein WCX74_03200 [Candidatus Paceibacterota bacterium]
MNQEYSKEFFWDTYKKLPEDLKEALFSDKNNEVINHICAQSGLDDEQTASVTKFAGRVLMGLLPLDELSVTIELELNIPQNLASQINRQIYISVFKHLRVSLNKINDKNFNYKDQFTSEDDGKEEERERKREEEAAAKRLVSKPFSGPKPPTTNLNTVSPAVNVKKEDIPPSLNVEPNKQTFPPSEKPRVEVEKPESVVIPEPTAPQVEIQKTQETSSVPAIPNPAVSIPSRSAFEQELNKETIPFPDIPSSFSDGSIPTVAIGKEENTPTTDAKIEIAPRTAPESSIPETQVQVDSQSDSLAVNTSDTQTPIEQQDAQQEQESDSKDPYKEMPL